jgi:hypothetical protein
MWNSMSCFSDSYNKGKEFWATKGSNVVWSAPYVLPRILVLCTLNEFLSTICRAPE